MKIALDAMGGDNAPHALVHGGVEALRASRDDLELVMVGDEATIKNELARHFRINELPISILHASQAIRMDEAPAAAVKLKKDSSISVAMRLLQNGGAQAMVSAGNTGAIMAAALFILKRLKNCRRPGIGTVLPTEKGPALVLDVGANVDCKPEDLLQFAVMGSIYFARLHDIVHPRVGLLNIGREDVKGNELTTKAFALLRASRLNFIGNIEGSDVLAGAADVVVCDGFIGNVVIKFGKSLHGLFKSNLNRLVRKYLFSQIGAVMMKPTFDGIRKLFDYQEYGGAPFLGVQGVCIKAHGRSSPRAIRNAVLAAKKMVAEKVNEHIQQQLELGCC
ncbi:phosphate acyltransferase PlsX [candidate division KSB1 bacterium]|nr:phosphate acyltransferase PlsX [candidate division KSB1 bacterium]